MALLSSVLVCTGAGQYLLLSQPGESGLGWLLTVLGIVTLVIVARQRARRAPPRLLVALAERFGARQQQLLLVPPSVALAAAAYVSAGPLPKAIHPILAPALWITALVFVVLAARQTDAVPSEPIDTPWSRSEAAAIVALGAAALVLRLAGNGHVPAWWTSDEASAGLTGVEFLRGERDNVFVLGWYSFPALYFLIPAVAIGHLGNDYAALRTPSAFAGAATVIGLYWLARPMFGRLTAACAALLLTALSYHIHFSRIGLQNVWDGLLTVLVLGAFWRGWHSGRRLWFVTTGLLLGLGQYFYVTARLLPLIVLGWLTVAAILGRELLRRRLGDLLWLALVALVVVTPLACFYLQHPSEFAAPMSRVALTAGWFREEAEQTLQPVWRLFLKNLYISAMAFTAMPLRYWYDSGKPMLLEVASPLFIAGFLLLWTLWRDPRTWLLTLCLGCVIAVGALTDSPPAGQRYVMGAPIAALIAAVGLCTVGHWAVEAWPTARRGVHVALGLVLALAMAREVQFYFGEYIPKLGYGSANDAVATALAGHLARQPADSKVYFFGAPRMSYQGFAVFRFLAPQVSGEDVAEPLTAPPSWPTTGTTFFVFLPHRADERALVEAAYPGGAWQAFHDAAGQLLFWLYTVTGPDSAAPPA